LITQLRLGFSFLALSFLAFNVAAVVFTRKNPHAEAHKPATTEIAITMLTSNGRPTETTSGFKK
jgi:hypothetical protein